MSYQVHTPSDLRGADRESRIASEIVGAAHAPELVPAADADLDAAVEYILDDCFFSAGQGAGECAAIDHAALMWWRDRYRDKFLRAMRSFGNTWLADRRRVTATCRLLGARAAEHAADKPRIDLDSAAQASRDVEQFCVKHAIRRSRRLGGPTDPDDPKLYAGYWCAM